MLTLQQFQKLFPKADAAWQMEFTKLPPEYVINTPERIAAFISQCGVETAGYTQFEENLNYSAKRMVQVWPKIFTKELADKCDHNKQLVANYAYANRMGNGDPQSGDGWKFRGRGPIHLTGRDNYTAFAKQTFDKPDKIIDNPDLLLTDKAISIKSALWFWKTNNLNVIADKSDVVKLTKRVNGGSNGLAERQALFQKIIEALK